MPFSVSLQPLFWNFDSALDFSYLPALSGKPKFFSENLMTGKQNGVAALLRKEHPGIINIHCICYKLALACADTKTELKDIDLAVDFAAIMEVFSKFSEKNFGLPESAGRYVYISRCKVSQEILFSSSSLTIHRLQFISHLTDLGFAVLQHNLQK
jgi:hypothetical protein